jgi:ABC-type transport system involved in multi-copper enzyme maturation permease subunit
MTKIAIIALNTFKEAIRNRVLYIILAFAILLMLCSGVISDLSVAKPQDTIRAIGLSAINFFSVLIAIFIGVGLVYNEIDKKTIYTIVSKPINRTQFILGKYFGLLLTIFINVLIMTIFFFWAIYFQQLTSDTAATKNEYFQQLYAASGGMPISNMTFVGYYVSAFFTSVAKAAASAIGLYHHELTKDLLAVICMNCFELAIITAFAVLFSTFSTPTLSSFLTVMTFLMGRGNEEIMRYVERMQSKISDGGFDFAIALKLHLANLAALIAPNLSIFNLTGDAIYEGRIEIFWSDILYGFCYPAAILALAALIFRRRNFK